MTERRETESEKSKYIHRCLAHSKRTHHKLEMNSKNHQVQNRKRSRGHARSINMNHHHHSLALAVLWQHAYTSHLSRIWPICFYDVFVDREREWERETQREMQSLLTVLNVTLNLYTFFPVNRIILNAAAKSNLNLDATVYACDCIKKCSINCMCSVWQLNHSNISNEAWSIPAHTFWIC